eukprot:1176292-Prorocentrum_minimum.AAC.3
MPNTHQGTRVTPGAVGGFRSKAGSSTLWISSERWFGWRARSASRPKRGRGGGRAAGGGAATASARRVTTAPKARGGASVETSA